MMGRKTKLEQVCRSMTAIMGEVPLTLKIRTGIYEHKLIAHELVPRIHDWGISSVTVSNVFFTLVFNLCFYFALS